MQVCFEEEIDPRFWGEEAMGERSSSQINALQFECISSICSATARFPTWAEDIQYRDQYRDRKEAASPSRAAPLRSRY